jgi:L-ascorbate metabolism protein UlaG (beta-lactamase superfamily)
VKQTWHGHSAFRIEAGEAEMLIDPFLSEYPFWDNGLERLPYKQELDTGR